MQDIRFQSIMSTEDCSLSPDGAPSVMSPVMSEVSNSVLSLPTVTRNIKSKSVTRNNPYWCYFKDDPTDKKIVLCTIEGCEKKVTVGPSRSASKLTNHMDVHHVNLKEKVDLDNCVVQLEQQGPMDSFVVHGVGFEEAYLRWVTETYQPFDSCNNEFFRLMCGSLNRKAQPLDRKTVARKISEKATLVKAGLMEMLKDRFFALTCDHWTSCAMQAYLAVTIHWIDDNWELISATLSCNEHSGEQTGIESRRILKEAWEAYGLKEEHLVGVTTDTAANMNSAGILYPCPHHYCLAHVLELTTKLAFEDENIPGTDGAMKAARHVVGHFKSSSQATQKLLDAQAPQATVARPALNVIQDVCTRWWSTYQMCARLLRLRFYIMELHESKVIPAHAMLTDEQWKVVKSVSDLLKPFMEMQKVLEGEQYVTISFMPYCIHTLRQSLDDTITANAHAGTVHLAKVMLTDFNRRWGTGAEGTVFGENAERTFRNRQKGLPKKVMLAAALDPRTKTLNGIPNEDKQQIMEQLKVEMLKVAQESRPAIGAIRAADPRPTAPRTGFLAGLGNAAVQNNDIAMPMNQQQQQQQLQQFVGAELDRFVEEVFLELHTEPGADGKIEYNNPLHWWRDRVAFYPNLSKLARRILCIPATSAPSERVFSAAGLTIASARASMKSNHAAACIFLHDSWSVVEKYFEKKRQKKRHID